MPCHTMRGAADHHTTPYDGTHRFVIVSNGPEVELCSCIVRHLKHQQQKDERFDQGALIYGECMVHVRARLQRQGGLQVRASTIHRGRTESSKDSSSTTMLWSVSTSTNTSCKPRPQAHTRRRCINRWPAASDGRGLAGIPDSAARETRNWGGGWGGNRRARGRGCEGKAYAM